MHKKILIIAALFTLLIRLNSENQENPIVIIYIVFVMELYFCVGIWKILKMAFSCLSQKAEKKIAKKEDPKVDVVMEQPNLPICITSKLEQPLLPESVLTSMRENYSLGQMKDDIRRLGDCLDIKGKHQGRKKKIYAGEKREISCTS